MTPKESKSFYLAHPYSARELSTRLHHIEEAMEFFSKATEAGWLIVNTTIGCHYAAMRHNLPKDFEFWRRLDEFLLGCCTDIIILKLDGYSISKGVGMELALASSLGMKVWYVDSYEDFKEMLENDNTQATMSNMQKDI